MLLSETERQWLEDISAHRGLTASDVLRVYIRETRATLPDDPKRKNGKHAPR